MRKFKKGMSRKQHSSVRFLGAVLAVVLILSQSMWVQNASASNTIYLNGSSGSDSSSGTSQAEAVHSLAKAKELSGGDGAIMVCGTIYVSGNTTWSLPAGVSLQRASGFSGPIVNITGTLKLNNVSLSPSDISGSGSIAGQETPKPTETPKATEAPKPTETPMVTETPTVTPEVTLEVTAEATPEVTPEVTAEASSEATPEAAPEESVEATPEATVATAPADQTAATPEAKAEAAEDEAAVTAQGTEATASETPEAKEQAAAMEATPEAAPENGLAAADVVDQIQPGGPQVVAVPQQVEINPTAIVSAILAQLKVTVETQQDVNAVVEATKSYEALDQEQRAAVAQELVVRLKKAQIACKVVNRISNGITVDGDLPWYVQFRVTKGNSVGGGTFDLGELLGSYEMKLWNLLADSSYKLDHAVTVTVPVENPSAYKDISVIHYLANGQHEVITPTILPNAISFVTTSFSPYNIAGNVLVGGADQVYNKTDNDEKASSQKSSGGSSNSSSSNSGSSHTSTSSSYSSSKAATVRTGDTTNLLPIIAVCAGAVIVIIALIIIGKKKK